MKTGQRLPNSFHSLQRRGRNHRNQTTQAPRLAVLRLDIEVDAHAGKIPRGRPGTGGTSLRPAHRESQHDITISAPPGTMPASTAFAGLLAHSAELATCGEARSAAEDKDVPVLTNLNDHRPGVGSRTGFTIRHASPRRDPSGTHTARGQYTPLNCSTHPPGTTPDMGSK